MTTFLKTKTKKSKASTGASTGLPVDWQLIDNPLGLPASTEEILRDYLELKDYAVDPGGARNQRFDLDVRRTRFTKDQLVPDGRYEVKCLYRRTLDHAPDRRIKVGSRGETIYGRIDALIKYFALEVERHMDDYTGTLEQFDDTIDLIDHALERKHSKKFIERFKLLAEAHDDLYGTRGAADFLEAGGVQGADILRGFSDIDGIFVMVRGAAGYYFTLVSQKEMPLYFEFDSVSVEGVKLRFLGEAPIET